MRVVVCAVRDSAMNGYARPIFVPTTAMAVRSFMDEAKNPQSEISKHKADYILFQIAEFDEVEGKFYNLDTPRQLIRGSDLEVSSGE